ncbi:polyphosphate kinase 2 family protein [Phycicoccus sp. SLBN-51]|uniref:polyphosphate kinase 2 family protein n=1 Tax=Phycicoccus sp. SLBN-51 TaxID=2768447 RepID=UPI0011534AB7|nr:polyphosphate kinase 2 family protein [Phycicoccus sp. SLBN-51]TQJ50502.1 PPK2 family polyphosphate:nucleotide phosphotransferase [Phycicoccus sp. SLBN-51]
MAKSTKTSKKSGTKSSDKSRGKGSTKPGGKSSNRSSNRSGSNSSGSSGTKVLPTPKAAAKPLVPDSFTEALRVGDGFNLFDTDPRSTPGWDGDKQSAKDAMPALGEEMSELQERLYAESKMGGKRSLLLVVQGMDTSGKGGIMRHVVGQLDPQGVSYTAFKAPTAEEKRHPFLWRIRNALPQPGQIGAFDRSQYEDVLVVRVHELAPRATWSRRYAQINAFERSVVDSGTTMVKVMLHISADEQKARLTERLDRPDKNWKFNPGDVDERMLWPAYQEAYQAALEKCSTPEAPWFVVPADRKWYARLAVQNLVLEHLRALDPQWPAADYDVETEKARLAAT